jgi:pyrimidine and pyridine-specific 5'-nucleotidase
MGFEDCFEGVICFETLNLPLEIANNMDALDNDAMIAGGEPEPSGFDGTIATRNKNKIKNDLDNGISSKSRILCKPSLEAIEAAIQIANVDPRKTVIFDS